MSTSRIRQLIHSTMQKGVIGMNFRNRLLVEGLNPRSEIAVARDKVKTKIRLLEAGIPTPENIAVINRAREIQPVLELLIARGSGFVVKPARSARGRGILLCRSIDQGGVTKLSGERISNEELLFHFYQTLHGEFSFGRPDDAVLVEELLSPDTDWILPGLPGAPDLRIILCMGKVLMAMARLPTSKSDGRANLHCGAVGIGIDLATGISLGGILNNQPIEHHPDSEMHLTGHSIQDFKQCIEMAERCCSAFKLGYIGVDLMRDIRKGPVVLEVNARPGLALQVANRKGIFQTPGGS